MPIAHQVIDQRDMCFADSTNRKHSGGSTYDRLFFVPFSKGQLRPVVCSAFSFFLEKTIEFFKQKYHFLSL